jgi:carbonic anhydrase
MRASQETSPTTTSSEVLNSHANYPVPRSCSNWGKGAIDNAQLGNLTGLLAKIRPAVEGTQYQGERSATNYGFVDAVARKNVELTMIDIHRRSPVLADLETSGAIKIAGAMYNLETGAVEFLG